MNASIASAEALCALFREFSEHSFSNELEFMAFGLPQLAERLGYARRDLHFEYAVGEVGSRLRADGVLVTDGAPRIVIETWLERRYSKRAWDERALWLRRYMEAAGAVAGLLITPRRLLLRSGATEMVLSLGETTTEQASDVLRALSGVASSPPPSLDAPFAALVDAVGAATSNDEKKKTLEHLAAILLGSCASLKVKFANLRTKSSEIDLVCECLDCDRRTPMHALGRYFLVECKNWKKPASAAALRDFIGKLQKTRCALGIVFSREGVTGEASGADAVREVRWAYDREHVLVLVVSLQDLRGIESSDMFIQMLDDKLDALRFDL